MGKPPCPELDSKVFYKTINFKLPNKERHEPNTITERLTLLLMSFVVLLNISK
jgi:hypothetical protein